MSKLVVINPGSGSLVSGFPQVTAKLWTTDSALPEQFVGSLPPAPELINLYRHWQLFYLCLCDRPSIRSFTPVTETLVAETPVTETLVAETEKLEIDTVGIEIDTVGITNISQADFHQVCQHLCTALNTWLFSQGFLKVERQLRSHLNPREAIRLILETNDEWLWRLPWHQWEFFQDYPRAEMALSKPEYKRQLIQPRQVPRSTMRILAILGNSQGIDLEAEVAFLNSLQDAETTFLTQPSRQEFNRQLWDRQGWDVLFFAGHSQTQASQTQEITGRLYINDHPSHNSITIQQLEEALKAAIEQGLQLAIFNSCDGLGLALALETLHIPTVAVMREPVPNQVAQSFFKYFLNAFAIEHLPFYQAIGQARRYLQGLEDEFPGASWLPVICQNPATVPPSWQQFREMRACSSEYLSSPPLSSPHSPLVERNKTGSRLGAKQYAQLESALMDVVGPIAPTLTQTLASLQTVEQVVKCLSFYLTPSQFVQLESQINALFQAQADTLPTDLEDANAAAPRISQDFIQRCQRSLTDALGPIAGFLIEQSLAASPQMSEVELVESLVVVIPNAQKAAAFRQRLLG